MSISGDHDERRHPPRRHHRAGARSSGLRPVLRGHPPAEADDIPSLRVLQGRLSRLRRPGEKKAGRSFAGPAHEPGGGGGDPQAHLQSLVAARRRLTVQNLLSALDVPAADPMPPFFRLENWVLNSLRASA